MAPKVAMDMDEPLLTENKSRFVMFPLEYEDVFRMYKQHTASYWTANEISLTQDLIDYMALNKNEQHFINHILAFFAASDGIVMENLSQRFKQDVPKPEVRAFYAFQEAMEAIHSETYSLLIDTYEKDPVKKDQLFNAVTNFPAIREKADWAIGWIESPDASFAQRLVGFAIVEGVFFSASFCAIFWMRKRGLLPGLSFANQLISRDETLHTDFSCLLYSKLKKRLPEELVYKMFDEAVDIENRFITESIPCSMIGMNAVLMNDYIKFIADRILTQLGYAKRYNIAKQPFDFMEMAAIDGKANFFETRPGEYSMSGVTLQPGQSSHPHTLVIDPDADF